MHLTDVREGEAAQESAPANHDCVREKFEVGHEQAVHLGEAVVEFASMEVAVAHAYNILRPERFAWTTRQDNMAIRT